MSQPRPPNGPEGSDGPDVPRPRPSYGGRPGREGTEPITARSAVGLRMILASVALPVFAVGTVLLALWAADSGPHDSPSSLVVSVLAGICGALALFAALDLAVLLRRRSRGSGVEGRGPGR
ncbi:DUF6343 family protein [Streptomyces sp. DT24]|uniref:DUF6343 family protein n=1 Tax=Streptomyces sp. DT24 TaxID=3416520 RepID=UPI003CFB7A38